MANIEDVRREIAKRELARRAGTGRVDKVRNKGLNAEPNEGQRFAMDGPTTDDHINAVGSGLEEGASKIAGFGDSSEVAGTVASLTSIPNMPDQGWWSRAKAALGGADSAITKAIDSPSSLEMLMQAGGNVAGIKMPEMPGPLRKVGNLMDPTLLAKIGGGMLPNVAQGLNPEMYDQAANEQRESVEDRGIKSPYAHFGADILSQVAPMPSVLGRGGRQSKLNPTGAHPAGVEKIPSALKNGVVGGAKGLASGGLFKGIGQTFQKMRPAGPKMTQTNGKMGPQQGQPIQMDEPMGPFDNRNKSMPEVDDVFATRAEDSLRQLDEFRSTATKAPPMSLDDVPVFTTKRTMKNAPDTMPDGDPSLKTPEQRISQVEDASASMMRPHKAIDSNAKTLLRGDLGKQVHRQNENFHNARFGSKPPVPPSTGSSLFDSFDDSMPQHGTSGARPSNNVGEKTTITPGMDSMQRSADASQIPEPPLFKDGDLHSDTNPLPRLSVDEMFNMPLDQIDFANIDPRSYDVLDRNTIADLYEMQQRQNPSKAGVNNRYQKGSRDKRISDMARENNR